MTPEERAKPIETPEVPEGIKKSLRLADEALAKSDAFALSRLHKEALRQLQVMIDGMDVVMKTRDNQPRYSDDAIAAMRDVSIAAIDLAKTIAVERKP